MSSILRDEVKLLLESPLCRPLKSIKSFIPSSSIHGTMTMPYVQEGIAERRKIEKWQVVDIVRKTSGGEQAERHAGFSQVRNSLRLGAQEIHHART